MIPPIYREPYGLPLRWQDDQTGELPAAVLAYFEKKPLTPRQFTLVRAYVIHYICAPCWDMGCDGDEEGIRTLMGLREKANKLQKQDEILPWIYQCLDVGIDPL